MTRFRCSCWTRRLLIGLVGLSWLAPSAGMAQPMAGGVSARHHPWGQFQPGAWKLVRVVTETLDSQGLVVSTSTTETKTTLMEIDPQGVVLEVAAVVEVAGKRFASEPQIVRQGFHGETLSGNLRLKAPEAAELTIEGQKIACQTQQIELEGSAGATVVDLWYSDTRKPYFLRREARTTEPEAQKVVSQTTTDVVALEMPWRVVSETRTTSLMKTVHRHAKGVTTSWAFTSLDIPGGVVSHSSKETDESGRVLRRSTLELVDYGQECEPARAGLFNRVRRTRLRDSAP